MLKKWEGRSLPFVSLVAFLALSGCSAPATSDSYPNEVRNQFITSCKANAALVSGQPESAFQGTCECLLNEIEADYSLADFEEAEADLLAGRASNIDFDAYAARCT